MSGCSLPGRSLLLAALVLAVGASARAQRLDDGESTLQEKGKKTRLLRVDLFKGTTTADPKDKDHQEAAAIAAKEVTYPLYWNTSGLEMPAPMVMYRLVDTFRSRLNQMTKFKAATAVYQQMYCRQVMDCAQEVLLKSRMAAGGREELITKPIAAINAARILASIPERGLDRGAPQSDKSWADDMAPRLAEGNGEHLATIALGLLEHPQVAKNDGTRYWLLRTLASLVSLTKITPGLLKKDTEEKAIAAAMKIVDKKVVFPKATPRQEVEGYKMLRREAIRVVAAGGVPMLSGKERPALTLARIAGRDPEVVPPPRLEEQLDAAMGLARMGAVAAKFPDYQPDYTVVQIALTVRDFAIQADASTAKVIDPRKRPWKVDAAKLIEALEALKSGVKNTYVQDAVKQCLNVVTLIEKGDQGNGANLGDWLAANPSPAKTVIKGADDTAVKPPPAEK
jgi:hypothetical protein